MFNSNAISESSLFHMFNNAEGDALNFSQFLLDPSKGKFDERNLRKLASLFFEVLFYNSSVYFIGIQFPRMGIPLLGIDHINKAPKRTRYVLEKAIKIHN